MSTLGLGVGLVWVGAVLAGMVSSAASIRPRACDPTVTLVLEFAGAICVQMLSRVVTPHVEGDAKLVRRVGALPVILDAGLELLG